MRVTSATTRSLNREPSRIATEKLVGGGGADTLVGGPGFDPCAENDFPSAR